MAFAKITLIGNLGRDAELKYTPQGIAVCSFSVAVSEKAKGDQPEVTTWYRCQLWRERGEKLQEFLTKGKQVYVEGNLKLDTYTDKEGNTRVSPDVNVDRIELLGTRADASEHQASAAAVAAQAPTKQAAKLVAKPKITDDDIPF